MFAQSRRLPWFLLLSLLLPIACTSSDDDENKDPDPDPDPDPSFWLVGDNGTMVQVDEEGEASGYPLELGADLLAIACHGTQTAWVAGESGTVLHSSDAGQTWVNVELDIDANWRALAVAEHSPEGAEALWLVGDAGAIAYTPDAGASWLTVAGADVDFTGVATDPEGHSALAVADDGSIWQLDEDAATQVYAGTLALRGVDLATHSDAPAAVAVGDAGTLLRLGESGWQAIELETKRDLFAVRVAADDSLTLAVGEDGIVVRIEAGEVTLLDSDTPTLRALHLGADGRGQAVGDAGTIVLSRDGGVSWVDLSLPDAPTLRGVDDFHLGGHL